MYIEIVGYYEKTLFEFDSDTIFLFSKVFWGWKMTWNFHRYIKCRGENLEHTHISIQHSFQVVSDLNTRVYFCVYIRVCGYTNFTPISWPLPRDWGGCTTNAKKPRREKWGDVTLMASGIIKIINIYHKKRKKKNRRSGAITEKFSFSSHRKREATESDVVILPTKSQMYERRKSSARAACDCATGHKGESRVLYLWK